MITITHEKPIVQLKNCALCRKHETVVKHVQIVGLHTTETVFLMVELAITRSKMGLET